MSAVSTGLRMALLTSGQAVEVVHVAPDLARVTAAHEEPGWPYPPHRLTAAAMDAIFFEAVEQSRWPELSSKGGGVGLLFTSQSPVPTNLHGLHGCYLYICIYECMYMQVLPAPPPPGMGSVTDMWGTPPPTLQSLQWT